MKSPFDFDISAASDKLKRKKRSRGSSGAFETSSRVCEKHGCEMPGKYRAPKSPTSTDEYIWFCIDHVREYNSKWNFFENDEDIDAQIESDKVGNRKTKPMNSEEAKAWARMGVEDPYEVLRNNATSRRQGANVSLMRLSPNDRKAIEILGAEEAKTKADIRKIYKSLVKDLHPDRNDGSRADEDRLNEVVWAWEQIKDSRSYK